MFSRVAAIALIIVASGCAVTTTDGTRLALRSDEFAAYVETVFRRQNDVATRLTLAIDAAEPGSVRATRLEAAELELLAACRDLNELATARRDAETGPGPGALRKARQTPGCERATNAAAALLADP